MSLQVMLFGLIFLLFTGMFFLIDKIQCDLDALWREVNKK